MLSAAVLIPIVAVLAWLGGWWFTVFVALSAGIAVWELLRLMAISSSGQPLYWLGVPVTMLLVLEGGLPQNSMRLQAFLTLVILVGLTASLFPKRKTAPTDLLLTLGASFYLGMTLRFLVLLRNGEAGLAWLILTALMVWAMDSGAYFIGVSFGKHKLYPRISPKKSWEGFFGGWASGILLAALLGPMILPAMSWWQGAIVGAIAGVAGPLGDFSESLFKRQAGVKDSSHLIPGHGGAFDRLDSFIFVAPVVYLFVQFMGW